MDKKIFTFWKTHHRGPYHFPVDLETWKQSWEQDTDSDGRVPFSQLHTETETDDSGRITGLILYGTTAFGFDASGEISHNVHYNVIRDLCFDNSETGARLLKAAISRFPAGERVYAFFHYFGMSSCARHGKLHERNPHVHRLLTDSGFLVEHENVYYTRDLSAQEVPNSPVSLRWGELSPGDCREFAAILQGQEVCWGQVHFLPQKETAYLRWIYVDEKRQHTGVGTAVMNALFSDLSSMGIIRFDTDTALGNLAAQHFYEKTGFENKGITRSYHTK